MNALKILNDLTSALSTLLSADSDQVDREIAVNTIRARARDLTDWADAQITKKEETNE